MPVERTNGALVGPLRSSGQLVPRPDHPHQVAVVTRAGVSRGTIQLWDTLAGRQIGVLSGDAISPVSGDFMQHSLVFSADGRSLLVQSADVTVRRWSVDQRKTTGHPMAVDHLDNLVSLTSDGTAITESADGYDLWATDTGRHIGALPTVLDIRRTAVVYEDRCPPTPRAGGSPTIYFARTGSPTSAPRPGKIAPKRSANASCPRVPLGSSVREREPLAWGADRQLTGRDWRNCVSRPPTGPGGELRGASFLLLPAHAGMAPGFSRA